MKDDGIGPKLVKQIKRSAGRMGIQCIYSAVSDLAILAEMEKADAVMFVDAVDFGGYAGQAIMLDETDLKKAPPQNPWTMHRIGLLEALRIARNQNIRPVVKIIGVQPAEIEWGLELSNALQAKMPILGSIVMSQARLLKSAKQKGD